MTHTVLTPAQEQVCPICSTAWAAFDACVNPKCDNYLKEYATRRFLRYFRRRTVTYVSGEELPPLELPEPWRLEQKVATLVCYAPRPDGLYEDIHICF